MTQTSVDISVIIPARDEVIAIRSLVEDVGRVLAGHRFEVIVIDDGSQDGTHHVLTTLLSNNSWMRRHSNAVSIGQSASIRDGVRLARGQLIVTLDGDGQNPADQIPLLLTQFDSDEYKMLGLVQGERQSRQDTTAKRWASHAANTIRRFLLKDGVRDSGCGLKAFRRDAYLDLPWFDHIHRFMPAMMLREGWHVQTVAVTHKERDGGQSKYNNLSRALVGVPDLLGAAWLIRRSGPPRHPKLPAVRAQSSGALPMLVAGSH